MAEKEHNDGEYEDGNLGIWQRRNMMKEDISVETWE
jgi:hypothetical protein